ncbi:LysM peptidoglycan-binding domain-containing protein [Bacillus spongiae]|uniref:LysM peptidoglycan-binding domain-containing protein n=1 Tax=Bacillus spongiae TaxID=2683610 RepID=A0ABU8HBT3_9BACI
MLIKLMKKYNYVLFVLVLTFISGFAMLNQLEETNTDSYLHITITRGDSLWAISDNFKEYHKMSTPEFISWVLDHNQLDDDNLYEGDSIIIPVNREELSDFQLDKPQYALKGASFSQ